MRLCVRSAGELLCRNAQWCYGSPIYQQTLLSYLLQDTYWLRLTLGNCKTVPWRWIWQMGTLCRAHGKCVLGISLAQPRPQAVMPCLC